MIISGSALRSHNDVPGCIRPQFVITWADFQTVHRHSACSLYIATHVPMSVLQQLNFLPFLLMSMNVFCFLLMLGEAIM